MRASELSGHQRQREDGVDEKLSSVWGGGGTFDTCKCSMYGLYALELLHQGTCKKEVKK